MHRRHLQRGLSLIESMLAMGVLLVGALGLVAINNTGLKLNADGRRMTRAVAIAQDLVNQVQLWDYTDPRLGNVPSANNDADIADTADAFETSGSPPFDHEESELESTPSPSGGMLPWNGVPSADLVAGGFQRYWNISQPDDANLNGIEDGKRIAVIVRWPQGRGWRRIVLLTTKQNPADRL
jgi:type II secretory pathway pseudopilin PulG